MKMHDRCDPQFNIYVAVSRCGTCTKIGITKDVKKRVSHLGTMYPSYGPFRLVRAWQTKHSRAVERIVKNEWRSKVAFGLEYYSVRPLTAVRKVAKEIRACESGKSPPAIRGVKYAWA